MRTVTASNYRMNVGRRRAAYSRSLSAWFAVWLVVICSQRSLAGVPEPRLTLSLGSRLNAFAVSADGSTIAAGGEAVDGGARIALWSVATGRQTASVPVAAATVLSVAFSPDGAWLAYGASDGSVGTYSLATRIARQWRTGASAVLSLAFSPDSALLATGGTDQIVRIWAPGDGASVVQLRGSNASVFALAFDARGTTLASGGADGSILLWSVPEWTISRTQSVHGDVVSALAFSPDGALASGGWDGNVFRTQSASPDVETIVRSRGRVHSVAFSLDGSRLAVGVSQDAGAGTAQLWHVNRRQLLARLGTTPCRGVAFAQDGASFVAASADGTLRVWTVVPETPAPLTDDAASGPSVAWSQSSGIVYEVQATATLPFGVDTSVALTSDVKWSPTSWREGTLLHWRVRTHSFDAASPWSETRRLRLSAVAREPALVRITATPERLETGAEGRIEVAVQNTGDLSSYGLSLTLKPALVSVSAIVEGTATRSDAAPGFWQIPVVAHGSDAIRITDIAAIRDPSLAQAASGNLLIGLRIRAERSGRLEVVASDIRLSDSAGLSIPARVSTLSVLIEPPPLAGDVNGDGVVDLSDLVLVARSIGVRDPTALNRPSTDLNGDGTVDIADLLLVAQNFGRTRGAVAAAGTRFTTMPSASSASSLSLAREAIRRHLYAADGSLRSALLELAELLDASTEPTVAPLLIVRQNHPNPFNPETWIPVRLSRPVEVSAVIYDLSGAAIRRLAVDASLSDVVDPTLHWDGRRDDGSECASGVYIARITATARDRGDSQSVSLRLVLLR